jgi:Uma2 family endonuclease
MSVGELPLDAAVRGYADVHSDEPLFEIIDGLRVELLMSAQNVFLASRLLIRLGSLVDSKKLGTVVSEMLFELPLAGRSRSRRPDVAFVSFDRWPEDRPIPDRGEHWKVVPDLAVEFVSPNDESEELMEKLEEYFESGVRQVWVVYPRQRVVYVFDSLTDIHGLLDEAVIDGGLILPGVSIPVSVMFPPGS